MKVELKPDGWVSPEVRAWPRIIARDMPLVTSQSSVETYRYADGKLEYLNGSMEGGDKLTFNGMFGTGIIDP